jgi:uncharacterized protein DUF6894
MLYYFHLKDGQTILDSHGSDLPDLAAVRHTALATTTEMLGDMQAGPEFWSGESWRLWVTDQPDGAGTTVLTLQFAVIEGDTLATAKGAPQLAVSSPEVTEAVIGSFPSPAENG